MYNWIDELKDILGFLAVYIILYEPLTTNFITPYTATFDAWFVSIFMFMWDRVAIVYVGAVIARGALKSLLIEPRSRIEEINYY